LSLTLHHRHVLRGTRTSEHDRTEDARKKTVGSHDVLSFRIEKRLHLARKRAHRFDADQPGAKAA